VPDVAIVGFAHERWGEAPHAFVVLRQGARADERELCEFARANLAHFKAPHSVIFFNELSKTATGKIQKYILRAQRPAIALQSIHFVRKRTALVGLIFQRFGVSRHRSLVTADKPRGAALRGHSSLFRAG
jgi:hypothetical protein